MPAEQEVRTVPEAVAIFYRRDDLQGAIDELLSSGFHRAQLSFLAGARAVEEKLGHRYEKTSALADDPPGAFARKCARILLRACTYAE